MRFRSRLKDDRGIIREKKFYPPEIFKLLHATFGRIQRTVINAKKLFFSWIITEVDSISRIQFQIYFFNHYFSALSHFQLYFCPSVFTNFPLIFKFICKIIFLHKPRNKIFYMTNRDYCNEFQRKREKKLSVLQKLYILRKGLIEGFLLFLTYVLNEFFQILNPI